MRKEFTCLFSAIALLVLPLFGTPVFSRTQTSGAPVDLSLDAASRPAESLRGNLLTYRLYIYNNSSNPEPGPFTLAVVLPRAVSFRGVSAPGGTCSTPRIGATGSVICTLTNTSDGREPSVLISVTVNAPVGSTLVATAQLSGSKPDPDLGNNSATIRTPVVAPDVDLAAQFRRETERAATNRPYTYFIGVGNGGPTSAFNVVLSHTLPVGFQFASIETYRPEKFCTTPPPGAGGRITCKLDFVTPGDVVEAKVTVTPTLAPGTPFTLTTSVSSSTPDRDLSNNVSETADFSTVAPEADVRVGVYADPAYVGQGALQRIGFTAANFGPESANQIVLTGTIPEGAQFAFIQLIAPEGVCQMPAVGASGAFTCTLPTMPVADQAWTMGAFFTITAPLNAVLATTMMIHSDATDPVPDNNASVFTHGSVGVASADVSLLSYDPDRASLPGGLIQINPNARNEGPNLGYPVVITTTLPNDVVFARVEFVGDMLWSCSTPAVGGTGDVVCRHTIRPLFPSSTYNDTIGYRVLVTNTAPIGTVHRFTSTVSASPNDTNLENNTIVNTTEVVTRVVDVGVQQSSESSIVKLGEPLRYDLLVFNRSNDDVRSVIITDVLPANVGFVSIITNSRSNSTALLCQTPAYGASGKVVCTLDQLDLNTFAAININVEVKRPDASGLTNTASVSSAGDEVAPENNTAVLQIPFEGYCSAPNLTIPDNNVRGIADTLIFSTSQTLADLDVFVQISHTYVSDLVVTLEHSRTLVTLLDRPGIPRTRYGCAGDHINARFDDAAALLAESQCAQPSPPNTAIANEVKPNGRLSTFDNIDAAGAWVLRVRDRYFRDVGKLVQWCLVPK